MPRLVWFRRDLRIYDNPALHHACKDSENGVIAIFFITESIWQEHGTAACQIDFIFRNLIQLSDALKKLNIPLQIKKTKTATQTEIELQKIAKKYKISTLYFNKQYEVDEKKRDQKVAQKMQKIGVGVRSFHDQVILAPETFSNKQGKPFLVYTPFKKTWIQASASTSLNPLPAPKKQKTQAITADNIPTSSIPKHQQDITWCKPGEEMAIKQLRKFCKKQVNDYQAERDFPMLDNTSGLSPYLAIGALSSKQCLRVLLQATNKNTLSAITKAGPKTWLEEIIWREFYKHILYHFPRVCKNQPFKEKTQHVKWKADNKSFQQWKTGSTGCPIVDAAMRQLNATGWMHNRLRMITASFLTKNLLIDWRLGEKYFMQQLLDGDFSANNGGWQWCASTGTDSAPYFRVFNPVTQSQRFDKDGEFIRQYCPELTTLNNKEIHLPKNPNALGYPELIVDLKMSRKRAIEAFQKIKSN